MPYLSTTFLCLSHVWAPCSVGESVRPRVNATKGRTFIKRSTNEASMFHAVNQMTGEEPGSPGTGALPMFREKNSSASRGGSSSRRTHQTADSSSGPGGISASMTPSDATTAAGGGAPMSLEMRPIHRSGSGAAPRRRRSGQLKDISGGRAVVTTASPNSTSNHNPAVAFAGPDGVDTGSFAEAGTFRWDATVADAATAQQDGLGEDDMGHEEGGGGGSSSRRNSRGSGRTLGGGSRRGGSGMRRSKIALSPPLSGDMADMALAARYHKPWFIITPESKIHQILDHLGELVFVCAIAVKKPRPWAPCQKRAEELRHTKSLLVLPSVRGSISKFRPRSYISSWPLEAAHSSVVHNSDEPLNDRARPAQVTVYVDNFAISSGPSQSLRYSRPWTQHSSMPEGSYVYSSLQHGQDSVRRFAWVDLQRSRCISYV